MRTPPSPGVKIWKLEGCHTGSANQRACLNHTLWQIKLMCVLSGFLVLSFAFFTSVSIQICCPWSEDHVGVCLVQIGPLEAKWQGVEKKGVPLKLKGPLGV